MMKNQRDWLLVYYLLGKHSKYEISHSEPEQQAGHVNNSNFNPFFSDQRHFEEEERY